MKKKSLITGVLSVLLSVCGVCAQNPICSLRSSYVDLGTKTAMSWHRVGEFPMKFEEDTITIEREFKNPDSNSRILVGVERVESIFKGVPNRLKIAISLKPSSDRIFYDMERGEAETIFDKSWKFLSISKDIQIDNRIYTFNFGCSKDSLASRKMK